MKDSFSNSAVNIRKIQRPQNADGKQSRIADYFASNVFDLRAMVKRLSSQDLETMAKVMKFGGKIDAQLAERIAAAAREWAMEKGATHYCHWFQPQTGATAEKHDAFLWFDKQGNPIERFTGPELLQSEPDASSFPSGGIRSTFEARGYTGWDPSSPMFIMETENGKTLYIPSVFISYHGHALDFKTPLLRSNKTLSLEAVKTLHLLGEKKVHYVSTSVGPEQEFFIIDKELALKRIDLKFSGRTVFGRKPPKGQELEDHYFAHIPSRVQAFFNELEVELYKLGVPIKTRHNEVAPGQFEIAPIFESSNIAADHNQLAMKCIKSIALKHGFVALMHEKPFAGVNGSGKHVNWSMSDSTGRNLLDPGATPHENLVFLTFLCAILQGIHDNADVLRASIASAGNDHRLGANEAPPAIISAFLGNTLDKILNALETGSGDHVNAEKIMIDLGISHLQGVSKDNTDRNRTSPFAFTGNKFEFRAVGSSASISYPTTILNSAVRDGLAKINAKLESRAHNGIVSDNHLLIILKEVIKETKKIRFEGNGYSKDWLDEAEQRGLSNLSMTPNSLAVLSDVNKTQFLIDADVFNAEDIESRLAIQQERYIKQSLIEVNCAIEMAQTQVLPVCLDYLEKLMENVKLAKELSVASPANKIANEIGKEVSHLYSELNSLKLQYEKIANDESFEHHNLNNTTEFIAQNIVPKLVELRNSVDLLESLVPSALWPYPKYSEMLFGIE
ncbi:glutamine synthetase III [Fluviispira multicolorata]|uniref:Glutamine synthetase type III n=1 Tax=Fluviispira multicolorata TaxID=2654512 RepID=A0A833N5B2_9BACT|nr:glutamine synthetase III [Fluviispira multicolorata]KAB8033204.1 glutamine synthetase type III [Fluviispira multicolorata]